jgi:hypothetical protein
MDHQITAIYDANILYPAPIRDLFLRLAQSGPPYTAGELLDTFEGHGLIHTVHGLKPFLDLL